MSTATNSLTLASPPLWRPGGTRAIEPLQEQREPPATPAPPSLDREAFARRFDEAAPTLRRIAAAEVGRTHAEDALQQAAIAALAALDRFTPGTDFRAWMAAFTRNAARNMRRSEHSRTRRERTLRLIPRRHNHAYASLASELPKDMTEALDTLSTTQRECLLLRVVGELSYEEIAATIDMPVATARSHVFRARAAMLQKLNQGSNTP